MSQNEPTSAPAAQSRQAPGSETAPVAPDGHLLVRMANSGTTSVKKVEPEEVLALPEAEAAHLVRSGLARVVRGYRYEASPADGKEIFT
jgi:hypothetical protein